MLRWSADGSTVARTGVTACDGLRARQADWHAPRSGSDVEPADALPGSNDGTTIAAKAMHKKRGLGRATGIVPSRNGPQVRIMINWTLYPRR
jgi:hypothetical protein